MISWIYTDYSFCWTACCRVGDAAPAAIHPAELSTEKKVVAQIGRTKINTKFGGGNIKSSRCKVQMLCERVRCIWLAFCCSNGIHGDVWKLCTSEYQRVPAPLGTHLQLVAGRVAAAGIIADFNPVMFLLHGFIPQFRGPPRQVGTVCYTFLVNSTCTQLYKSSACGNISYMWPSKCIVCFSIDVLNSPLKETSGQPPALPPKRSRISSVRSAASPPPISPPPTSRLQQELNPKLHHSSGDVDISQTRFCICGISSHMWTHQLDKVLYLWH